MIGREDTEESLAPDPDLRGRRFIADAMLGRLARWLRFLGVDTQYYADISDSRLIRIAIEQERVILTRDTRLVRTKKIGKYLLVTENEPLKQLVEVIRSLKLRGFDLLSRCVKCNGHLEKIGDKKEIMDAVPEYVFLQYNDFFRCPDCGQIYWEGTHPKKFREKVRDIIEGALDN